MKDKRYIKKRYIFINIIMIGLAVWLIFLPDRHSSQELKPELLLREINDENRFISPDYLAEKIIASDRHIILIDVRTLEEYDEFHLPSAINIPLKEFLDVDDAGNYSWDYDSDVYQIIFYSNGTVYANQAWMISRRLNISKNYVLDGGLNKWFETIIIPPIPHNSSPDEEIAQYDFRKAASMFFGEGGEQNTIVEQTVDVETPVVIPKKDNSEEEEGGC